MTTSWNPLTVEEGGTGGTTPASARRALRLGALATGNTAADITFTPAGAGAVARSVQAELRDTVKVQQFGAIGDGVTDDTAAFQAAAARNVPVFVPSNLVYKVTAFVSGNFYSFGYPTFAGGGGISDGSFIRRHRTMDQIVYNGSSPLWSFGDSFTTGTGASVAARAYANRVARALGPTFTNYGVGGSASYQAVFQLFNIPILASDAVNQTAGLVTWMAAFNDVYRGAAAAKTLTKIKGGLRAFLSARFATFAIAGNQVATVTGVWANLAAGFAGNASRGERSLGFLGRSTVTNGSTMTQATTGDNVVIHTFATDGVSALSGSFTVSVDGTVLATYAGNGLADGISDGAYNNQITHDAVVLTGLGSGAHSVVITATVDATHPIYIDSIETMMPAQTCAPVLVSEGAFQPTAGWALGGGVWSQAAMEASTNAVNETVEEFIGYPIAVVRINDYFNTSNGIATDNNHPNDTGHGQIAAAFLSAICPLSIQNLTIPSPIFSTTARVTSSTSPTAFRVYNTFADAANRNWAWCGSQNVFGDMVLRISNAQNGDPIVSGTDIISFTANGLKVGTAIATSNIVTETNATRTVLVTDSDIICNRAGTVTLTLLAAATYPGRELWVRTIQAQTVVSAAADVVPLIGGAAGTAILAATAGRWARLKSDGSSWQIMAGN